MPTQSRSIMYLLPPFLMLLILSCICPFSGGISSDLRKGIEAFEACDPSLAMEHINTALESDSKDAQAYFYRGRVNYYTGKFQDAIEDLTVAISLRTEYPEASYYRGLCYEKLGNTDLAEEDFQSALDGFNDKIEQDAREAEWYLWRGNVHVYGFDDDEAGLDDYKQAIELDPEFAEAYNRRGNVFDYALEDWEAALDDFNTVLELDANCHDLAYALNYIGHIKDTELNDREGAIEQFLLAIETDPYLPYPYHNLGVYRLDDGEYEKAISYFNEAIELDPRYASAFNDRGVAYGRSGDIESAIAEYSKAIEISPDWALPLNNRGLNYYDTEEYELARADFIQLLILEPEDVEVMNDLGRTYRKLNDLESAKAEFTRAIQIDVSYHWPYYNRGLINDDLGDTASAIADFNQFLSLYQEEDEYSSYAKEYILKNTITGPTVTQLLFAKDIDENNTPINISNTFSSDTTIIYAFATYAGMIDGASCESVWSIDDEEFVRNTFTWELGASGTTWVANVHNNTGEPLVAGTYRWDLYCDASLIINGTFIKE
jgi:tetratricopeptide (TPR) repeat protein